MQLLYPNRPVSSRRSRKDSVRISRQVLEEYLNPYPDQNQAAQELHLPAQPASGMTAWDKPNEDAGRKARWSRTAAEVIPQKTDCDPAHPLV